MKTFTPAQLNDFLAYVKVQESGRHNMLDPRAARAAGLSRDQMVFVIEHYAALKAQHKAYNAEFNKEP
jgi:hypothetical protein